MMITEDSSRKYIQVCDSSVLVCVYKDHEHNFNYEPYRNKNQQGKTTKVDGWKCKTWLLQATCSNKCFKRVFKASDGWLAIFKIVWHQKKGIFCELLRERTEQFSSSDVSSLQWGQEMQVQVYWRYQKFL